MACIEQSAARSFAGGKEHAFPGSARSLSRLLRFAQRRLHSVTTDSVAFCNGCDCNVLGFVHGRPVAAVMAGLKEDPATGTHREGVPIAQGREGFPPRGASALGLPSESSDGSGGSGGPGGTSKYVRDIAAGLENFSFSLFLSLVYSVSFATRNSFLCSSVR